MHPPRRHAAPLTLALALLLSACGSATDDEPAGAPATTTTSPGEGGTTDAPPADPSDTSTAPTDEDTMTREPIVPEPTPDLEALPTGPVPDGIAERPEVVAAVEDYAKRAGVDVSEVSVEGFAQVTWSDGSLGCPEPGMMYTMALVPGYQLVLGVGGQLASYHAAEEGPFTYCANPVPPAETMSTS